MAHRIAPLEEERFYILPDYIKEQESLMRTKLNYLTAVLANKHANGLPLDKQQEFEQEARTITQHLVEANARRRQAFRVLKQHPPQNQKLIELGQMYQLHEQPIRNQAFANMQALLALPPAQRPITPEELHARQEAEKLVRKKYFARALMICIILESDKMCGYDRLAHGEPKLLSALRRAQRHFTGMSRRQQQAAAIAPPPQRVYTPRGMGPAGPQPPTTAQEPEYEAEDVEIDNELQLDQHDIPDHFDIGSGGGRRRTHRKRNRKSRRKN